MNKTLSVIATTNDGRKVRITAQQAAAIEALDNTRKGGCASVIGYIPSSNWVESPVHDIQMITHFSTAKLYERKREALMAIKYDDVKEDAQNDEKLSELSDDKLRLLFEDRKHRAIASILDTNDGYREDAHRQAHDRCYAYFGDVKVHLQTEKVDGIKQPVEDENGNLLCASIMVPYLELKVTERKPGVRKNVNSGAPVRMSNMIDKCLNGRSVGYKTLSLKEDNFQELRVDRKTFLPEEVATFGELLTD